MGEMWRTIFFRTALSVVGAFSVLYVADYIVLRNRIARGGQMSCRFAHQPQARSTTRVESTKVPSISKRTAVQVKVNGMK